MFEQMNYAEIEKMRDALLLEASGLTETDEGKLQVIGELSVEMESREAEASRRVLSAVACINILVLSVILFCSGCQTLKGVTGDTGWMLTKLSENINTEKE